MWSVVAQVAAGPGYARVAAAFAACGLEMWELYGHGPPASPAGGVHQGSGGGGGGGGGGGSFMWPDEGDQADWARAHPPPLEPIGDVSEQAWRAAERARYHPP